MNYLDEDRYQYLDTIVDHMFDLLARRSIARFKQKHPGMWRDYVYQIYEGEDVAFEELEEVIKSTCWKVVEKTDQPTQALLWLWSEGFIDRESSEDDQEEDDEAGKHYRSKRRKWDDIPLDDDLISAVAEHVYRHLFLMAEITDSPQVDREASARFAEDMELDRLHGEAFRHESKTEGKAPEGDLGEGRDLGVGSDWGDVLFRQDDSASDPEWDELPPPT